MRCNSMQIFIYREISAYCCIMLDFFNLELRCTEPRIKKKCVKNFTGNIFTYLFI